VSRARRETGRSAVEDAAGRPELHSLHVWSAPPAHLSRERSKPDRFLVGLLAGAALFYLFGRAMGLGRR